MPMNAIQFQKGLSLPEFMQRYGTETQCEAALEKMRWPKGFRCPRCSHSEYTLVHQGNQRLRQCRACRHQTSLRVGTLFQASKLPLTVWFLAFYLITQAKNGVSALELMRSLGVSYRTAWRLKHKILHAMAHREETRVLSGRVEVDDAYLGGVRPGKRGRGAAGKAPFVVAVETRVDAKDGEIHPIHVRFDPLADFRKETLARWAETYLAPETLMVSDGLNGLVAAGEQVSFHDRVIVGKRKSSELDCFHWVNTLIGNLKNAIRGTCHGFKVSKYAARYLREAQYRFNRRFDLPAMIPRLLYACVHTPPYTEKQLRLAELCN